MVADNNFYTSAYYCISRKHYHFCTAENLLALGRILIYFCIFTAPSSKGAVKASLFIFFFYVGGTTFESLNYLKILKIEQSKTESVARQIFWRDKFFDATNFLT